MFGFLLTLIPISIILVLSSGLVKLFNYKIEHANFLTVCSITLLLIVFGLIGFLNIGLIFIYILAITSLVYLLVTKIDIKTIFTPAIVFLIFNMLVFSFLIREISLYTHDEVSHWALATKSMYYGGDFYKGLQGMFTATFNFFITKTSFYAPSQLYLGSWFLIWSCFILPMGDIKWSNWKRAGVYLFAAYCLTGFLIKDVAFHIDEFMAFMSASVIAYWAMNRKKSNTSYVLAIIGIIAISQIKESFGPLCSFFVAAFILINDIYISKETSQKISLKIMFIPLSAILGFILSLFTIKKPEGYLSTDVALKLPVINLLLQSKSFLLLGLLVFIFIVLTFVFLNRNTAIKIKKTSLKLNTIFFSLLLIFIVMIIYKFTMYFLVSLSFEDMQAHIQAWRTLFYTTQGGRTNILSIAVISIISGFACYYAFNKQFVKINMLRAVILISNIIAMGAIVLIAYSTGFDETGMYRNSMSWDRYTSIPYLIAYTYIIGYFILSDNIYKNINKKIMVVLASVLMVAIYLPFPTTIAFAKFSPERVIFKGVQNAVKEDADILNRFLNKDETVFVASYSYEKNANESGEGRIVWLKYEISPIESSWQYNSDFDEVIGSTASIQTHALNISKYDYMYIQSAGPKYYEKFGSLYPDGQYYYSNALYKVNYENNELTLTPVYLDESRLLP